MSELPHVDSFDPEDGGGLAPPSKSENSGATDAAHEEARRIEPVELDIADSHFMADAYDTYADLRAKGPVSRVRFAGGEEESGDGEESREFFFRNETFFVTHYNEVIATLLDDRFSADPRSGLSEELLEQPPMPEELRPLSRSILLLDPPDHTRLRKLVQPSFTGRGMQALRGSIQQIVDDLRRVKQLLEAGEITRSEGSTSFWHPRCCARRRSRPCTRQFTRERSRPTWHAPGSTVKLRIGPAA